MTSTSRHCALVCSACSLSPHQQATECQSVNALEHIVHHQLQRSALGAEGQASKAPQGFLPFAPCQLLCFIEACSSATMHEQEEHSLQTWSWSNVQQHNASSTKFTQTHTKDSRCAHALSGCISSTMLQEMPCLMQGLHQRSCQSSVPQRSCISSTRHQTPQAKVYKRRAASQEQDSCAPWCCSISATARSTLPSSMNSLSISSRSSGHFFIANSVGAVKLPDAMSW